ncbi:cilia- and flagella-associated protein 36-like protein [Leptotrombidium deliense]|uniref:Cilia- and flagella-associated protein 36 n=1 Tax=Leptotrombidium deliense TaxID=299467 RepID=A0A443SLW8_9ACAR|nr:cilia- and flagella-associated protein 36-like protein [Leptotrombidium deliense]
MSKIEKIESIDSDVSWILDSLIGFLKGPVWNLPIINFVEQKSVVFEPDENEGDEEEYGKIYEEYKSLVDRLLGTHMEELGIAPEQFEESCVKAEGALSSRFHHVLFEQIWAANDYEIFKRMMIQRNIDLQLQALEILSQRYGFSLESFIPEDTKYDFLIDEDALMEEVIKRSLEEQKLEDGAVGNEHVIKVTIEERQRLEAEKEKKQEMLEKAIHDAINGFNENSDQSTKDGKPMVKRTDSSSPADSTVSKKESADKSAINDMELKKRQEYLRKQRDLLVEAKKKERRKQLNKVEESEMLAQRPKSAKTIRSVFEENRVKDENEDKGLAFRKSLAARLKSEVIGQCYL